MTASARPVRRVPLPRVWPIRASDLAAVAIGNGLLIVGMWVRHGNLAELDTLGGILTAGGQLTALLGTYLVLIQLLLMARSPWLDQAFGSDRLVDAHRWMGYGAIVLLAGHVLLTTVGYAMGDGSGIVDETVTLLTAYPYVLMATVSAGLFVLVIGTSIRLARQRLSHETWYGLHLYALSVATSAAYERGDHILVPATHRPPAGLVSLTVVGPSLTYADAFATAAFAMGRDGVAWLADRPSYEALAITDDDRLVWTPGMDALLA